MNFFRITSGGRILLFSVTLAFCVMTVWFGCSRSMPKRPRFVDPLAKLKTGLGMFEVDNGRYPTTAEGLDALLSKPSGLSITNWRGPYLEKASDLNNLKDPWGHEFIYRCPGAHNPDRYDLYSMGPDGKDGTPDDIGNWPVTSDNQ